jgi:hypothetical protein
MTASTNVSFENSLKYYSMILGCEYSAFQSLLYHTLAHFSNILLPIFYSPTHII